VRFALQQQTNIIFINRPRDSEVCRTAQTVFQKYVYSTAANLHLPSVLMYRFNHRNAKLGNLRAIVKSRTKLETLLTSIKCSFMKLLVLALNKKSTPTCTCPMKHASVPKPATRTSNTAAVCPVTGPVTPYDPNSQ
jgi:hypothetical protein